MLRWTAVALTTGEVVCELPDLQAQWPLRKTLGTYDLAAALLPLSDRTDPEWTAATRPYAAALLAWDPDLLGSPILWDGIVVQRGRGSSTPGPKLSLVTTEGYTARVSVDPHAYSGVPARTVIGDLVGMLSGVGLQYVDLGGGDVNYSNITDLSPTGWIRSDNSTVYQKLAILSGMQGGPEWTIRWAWADEGVRAVPTLYAGERIGAASPATRKPNAQFTYPGPVLSWDLLESYASGDGANRVWAYSSGSGDSTPISDPQTAVSAGRPVVDHIYQPDSNITVKATLDGYAGRALAAMLDGVSTATVVVDRTVPGARLGVDWHLGDDVWVEITADRQLPVGAVEAVLRPTAVELVSDRLVHPLFAQVGPYVAGGSG